MHTPQRNARIAELAAAYLAGRGLATLAIVPMGEGVVPRAYVAAEWSDCETVTWLVVTPFNGETFAESGHYFRGPDRFRDAVADAVDRAEGGR